MGLPPEVLKTLPATQKYTSQLFIFTLSMINANKQNMCFPCAFRDENCIIHRPDRFLQYAITKNYNTVYVTYTMILYDNNEIIQ